MSILYLGIDTSNYKTSVAIVDQDLSTVAQKSVLLEVPEGKRGLRQSEAFFAHSNRLPGYLHELMSGIDTAEIAAIGVSESPRRAEGSYMPCFLAGLNAAGIIGESLRIPVFRFSHQEGHAAAVLEGSGIDTEDQLIFFHLSGGTTEALLCRRDENGYCMEKAGGTLDISLGQLLDRFGVASGLPFPAGRYLDDMAYEYLMRSGFDTDRTELPGVMPVMKKKDPYFNLSGAETRLMRSVSSDKKVTEALAAELFLWTADLLHREAAMLSSAHDSCRVVMAGGVSSSRTIRRLLADRSGPQITFGDPVLSGDNAVGIARLAKRIYETRNRISGK